MELATLRKIASDYFVVLDTETTGLNAGEICQIAIVNCFGKTLLDTYVKPTIPIPLRATSVHGIIDKTVESAPGWEVVSPQVRAILYGTTVVVYNAKYDRRMMHQSAEAVGLAKTDWKLLGPWVCAMEAFAEWNGDYNETHHSYTWLKLARAAQMCNVEVKDTHNALGDCLMTLGVVRYICRHPGNDPLP